MFKLGCMYGHEIDLLRVGDMKKLRNVGIHFCGSAVYNRSSQSSRYEENFVELIFVVWLSAFTSANF